MANTAGIMARWRQTWKHALALHAIDEDAEGVAPVTTTEGAEATLDSAR